MPIALWVSELVVHTSLRDLREIINDSTWFLMSLSSSADTHASGGLTLLLDGVNRKAFLSSSKISARSER